MVIDSKSLHLEIKMLMENQKSSIRFYTLFTIILWTIGIAILVIILKIKIDNKIFESVLTALATLIAALSAVPLKEIISKKEKLAAYKIVNIHVESLSNEESKINSKEYQKMKDLIWKIVENTTLA